MRPGLLHDWSMWRRYETNEFDSASVFESSFFDDPFVSIEEMLASIGHALDPDADAIALHYRHLSVSILRQLRLGRKLEGIILDRARGHVVSQLDPVTGGVR